MKIKVYSTHSCHWCGVAKDFLRKNKIEFEEIFVDDDVEKAKGMVEKSGQQGVPVIDIDGEIIIGFDEEKLKQLLKIK